MGEPPDHLKFARAGFLDHGNFNRTKELRGDISREGRPSG
jgi:hypothetical protein